MRAYPDSHRYPAGAGARPHLRVLHHHARLGHRLRRNGEAGLHDADDAAYYLDLRRQAAGLGRGAVGARACAGGGWRRRQRQLRRAPERLVLLRLPAQTPSRYSQIRRHWL